MCNNHGTKFNIMISPERKDEINKLASGDEVSFRWPGVTLPDTYQVVEDSFVFRNSISGARHWRVFEAVCVDCGERVIINCDWWRRPS